MRNEIVFDSVTSRLGGLAGLARACRISSAAVAKWRERGVPLDRCAAIESATKGQVRCEDLRNDVDWTRDERGHVTGYHVRVSASIDAPRAAKAA